MFNQLIYVESRNNPNAVSHKNAVGLGQITKPVLIDYYRATGINYSLSDMTNIKKNLKVSRWNINRLMDYYGCVFKATSAYNTGYGNTSDGMINFQYLFLVIGTNETLRWLDGRNVTPWRSNNNCYYVEGL